MENTVKMKQIRGTQKEVAAQSGTWETLVASAKNFFISSSVDTTFIAEPLWKWERREPRSASFVNSRERSVLGTRAQGSQGYQLPLNDRPAKEAPDSSHLLCSWAREAEVAPNYPPLSFPEKTGDLQNHRGEIKKELHFQRRGSGRTWVQSKWFKSLLKNLIQKDVTFPLSTPDAQFPLCLSGQAHRGCGGK